MNELKQTLTYAELVAKTNEYGNELLQRIGHEPTARERAYYHLPEPPEEVADWVVIMLKDPRGKLVDAMSSMLGLPSLEIYGLRAQRDAGERNAKLRLDGYYGALSRCLEIDGIARTISEWKKATEADDASADLVDGLVAAAIVYYRWRSMVHEKKSPPRSIASNGGETSD